MCGIFGVISRDGRVDKNDLSLLVKASRQRGRDSSGLAFKARGSKLLSRGLDCCRRKITVIL